jgi:SAM-dependent methyltransferase
MMSLEFTYQHEATLNELNPNSLLIDLLMHIKCQGYRFTTVTPKTHALFFSKSNVPGKNLRDIFGWNLPFSMDSLCPALRKLMLEADIIEPIGELFRSKLRISSLGGDIFLHSSYPTEDKNAVFFGPDTYRFARFIRQSLEKYQQPLAQTNKAFQKPLRILDIGCGTGAGGIAAIRALPQACPYELTMNDINTAALDLMHINACAASVPVNVIAGDIFELLSEEYDLIIANPPYMHDEMSRAYRDGGANLGLDFSIRILKIAFEHLSVGGNLILYTGVAMTPQADPFLSTLVPLLASANCTWSYEEIDPDIFSEELELPAYANAHRIAAVGLVVTKH